MRPLIIFLLLCILLCTNAQTGLQAIQLYSAKEGLSHSQVNCLKQDSKGFLWIGTPEGLNRFDGFRFRKYFSEKNNPNSLPHSNVLDILEYQQGRLLIATSNGLAVLNTLTGRFENEKIKNHTLQPSSANSIFSLYKDKLGQIWVNHQGELDLLDSNLNYITRVTDLEWTKICKGALVSTEPWQTDKGGRLWFMSDTSGINIIDWSAKKAWNHLNNPEHLPYLDHHTMRSFLLDEANNAIWYAPWGEGLYRYDIITKQKKNIDFDIKFGEESITVNTLIKTWDNKILCGIGSQCFELDPKTLGYSEVSKAKIKGADFSPINLLESATHQYWMGMMDGLVLLDKQSIFKEIPLPPNDQNKTAAFIINSIFISSSGKLFCAASDNRLIVFNADRSGSKVHRLPGKKDNLFITTGEDKLKRIWAGTTNGLYLLDETTGQLVRPPNLPKELEINLVNTIFGDADSSIWIGTRLPFSLFHYDPAKGVFDRVINDAVNQVGVSWLNGRISNITADPFDNLWMTSKLGGGIIRYNKKDLSWKIFPSQTKESIQIVRQGIRSLAADDQGYLWFSDYRGDGLMRYDYRADSVVTFSRADGLLSNYIDNIAKDAHGKLWLSSAYGITSFDPVTNKVETTIATNPVYTNGFDPLLDVAGNKMMMALPDRLLQVSLEKSAITSAGPQPVIDGIWVNNTSYYQDPFSRKLVLNYQQQNISIDFTAVDLTGRKIKFAYQLSDVDKEWRFAEDVRTAQYSILAPGRYIFNVKAAADNGEWSEPVTYEFIIKAPWWQTRIFIAGIFALAVLITWLLTRRRIARIRQEAALKQKITETETMALRAQMNPHFIFNCINSIDALIHSNDKYNATVYLNKFAKMIRGILDSSRQNTVTLAKELETLQLYIDLELFRHENKFVAGIKADPALLQDDFKVPPLIIQPYVENAILHGLRNRVDNGGKLLVSVDRQDEYIRFIIEDNGVGRAAAAKQEKDKDKSYGIQMSNERVKLFNKENVAAVEITDLENNGQAAGTRVVVLLKIK